MKDKKSLKNSITGLIGAVVGIVVVFTAIALVFENRELKEQIATIDPIHYEIEELKALGKVMTIHDNDDLLGGKLRLSSGNYYIEQDKVGVLGFGKVYSVYATGDDPIVVSDHYGNEFILNLNSGKSAIMYPSGNFDEESNVVLHYYTSERPEEETYYRKEVTNLTVIK